MGQSHLSPPWSTTVKIVVVVFAVVAAGIVVWRFEAVIPPLVIACLIAYILAPVVNYITAHTRVPEGVVTGCFYLLFFGLLVLAVGLLAPLLMDQILSLNTVFGRIGADVEAFVARPVQIGNTVLDLAPLVDELIATLTGLLEPLAAQTVALLASIVGIVVQVIFIGIVSFYLTKDGPKMGRWLVQWVPSYLRHDFERLRVELDMLWRAFLRGQLLLALTMGVTVGVLMGIVGMKNALLLGVLAFFLEFLPSVGHGIWLVVAVPLALFQGSRWLALPDFWVAVLVLGIHLVLEQVDVNYLIPRIVGRQVKLHPMVVVIGIIGGGLLAGVLGMLLAAPTIASAGVLARYVYCKLLDQCPWPDQDEEDRAPEGVEAEETEA